MKCDYCGSEDEECYEGCTCAKCINPEGYEEWRNNNPEAYDRWLEKKLNGEGDY